MYNSFIHYITSNVKNPNAHELENEWTISGSFMLLINEKEYTTDICTSVYEAEQCYVFRKTRDTQDCMSCMSLFIWSFRIDDVNLSW